MSSIRVCCWLEETVRKLSPTLEVLLHFGFKLQNSKIRIIYFTSPCLSRDTKKHQSRTVKHVILLSVYIKPNYSNSVKLTMLTILSRSPCFKSFSFKICNTKYQQAPQFHQHHLLPNKRYGNTQKTT